MGEGGSWWPNVSKYLMGFFFNCFDWNAESYGARERKKDGLVGVLFCLLLSERTAGVKQCRLGTWQKRHFMSWAVARAPWRHISPVSVSHGRSRIQVNFLPLQTLRSVCQTFKFESLIHWNCGLQEIWLLHAFN